ncbi:hypothetical protein V7183_12690 [Bacillus sp. JJ1127]|uniref:hypothetical protein n=1 Tax=Bacillus sp. JJ1127 TaxID=3122952 RepID=UPI002FFFBADB
MFSVGILSQCKNCNVKNAISDINNTCGHCDNNKLENFKIIMPGEPLKGMGGMYALTRAREILESALNREEVLIIDPERSYNNL